MLITVFLYKISCAAKAVHWLTAIYIFTLYAAVNWFYHVIKKLMRVAEYLSSEIKLWNWVWQNDVTLKGFKLVKQNQFAKIYKRNKEKGPQNKFFGFVNHFMKNVKGFNPLSTNITKWSNTLKQFVVKLPTNYLSVTILWDWRLKGQLSFAN